jgi:Zn-dependent protease with chaperone function
LSPEQRNGVPHLGLRAAMALGLLVGFYVLALTLSLGLFALAGLIVYLSIQHHRTPAVLLAALVLVGAGFAVLRGAITSARIRTGGEAPLGIPTSPATEPRLWAEVGQLADLVEARAPAEIHLVPGVNAFVHQESRLLGMVRGKVVLGVGLGLLSVLDRDGLRSVLAHELGHISARDTRLGPLTYRARFAILRTVETLEDRRTPFRKELARLFRGYFRLFMRFSMAVSRAQERAADRASVRAAGAPAAARALETIGIADHAFDFFTDRYVVPLWRSGRWPQDLYPGFRAFVAERSRDGEFGRLREAVLAAGTDRWDSHPSIGERIRLIMSEGGCVEPPGLPVPAWRVLADPARTEREMARLVASSATGAADVRPITWDRASADVLGPATAGTAERVRSAAIAVGGP